MALEYRDGHAGGCLINGEETCVAQHGEFCDEGTFIAAHTFRKTSGLFQQSCYSRLDDVVIGRCGDSGKCSNVMEQCADPSTFVAFDSTCTIILDMSTDKPTPVTYGKCATVPLTAWQSGDRCVWSSDDCSDGEVYVRDVPRCTADKVAIGACFAGYAYCAISQKSCVDQYSNEPFMDHQEVQKKLNAFCYLADLPAPSKAPTPPKAPSPKVIEHIDDSQSEASPELVDIKSNAERLNTIDSAESSTNGGLDQTVLLIIVVISAVIAGIVVGVGTIVYWNRKKENRNVWRDNS